MAKKTRTVITIETRQRTVVRRRAPAAVACCPRCRAEVPMLTPDEAAALARTTAREIYRRVEAGELHSAETADGRLLVCLSRLLGETPGEG